MINNDEYRVVYASDDNFSEVMGISIVSLLDNNKEAKNINIYILDSGISETNKENIRAICKSYERNEPIFIEAINIEKKLNMSVQLDRGSVTQYARLFISELLPKEIERVLYLDCDIIVNKSLTELWNLNLNGKTIAALMDAFSKYYRKNIELNDSDIMFNSGVMLIDLERWKKLNIEDKLINFIKRNNGKIQQGDQGVLNAVLSNETYCFEPRFNLVTIFCDFTYKDMLIYRKPPYYYDEELIKKAITDPVIIHYTTSFLSERPWIDGCNHKYVDLWIKYREMSPWAKQSLRENNNKFKKIFMRIYNTLPYKVSLSIVSFLQVYVRPLKRQLINKKGLL